MIALRNRRSVRPLLIGAAAGVLLLGPARLMAQVTVVDSASRPKTHTVKKGDTLWDLAAKYLGDAFRWPDIYRLNTDVVEDPHWIYPNEILKLPGYGGPDSVALAEPGRANVPVTPPTAAALDTAPPVAVPEPPRGPTLFARPQNAAQIPTTTAPAGTDTMMQVTASSPSMGPQPTIRFGDVISAPWVDRRQGPPVWGRIVGSADLPGIDPARQRGRFQLNDRILIAPPAGSVGPERELYLAYHEGPLLEAYGRVIVPTGVVEVIQPPVNGDAAIARIVRMFGEVNERDRLMPYDSSFLAVTGTPSPIKNGAEGKVTWIPDEPVLPSINYFIVLSLNESDGAKIGDEVELYRGRIKAHDEGEVGIPEIQIGRAQIVKVTPFGATAMITRLDQPKVETGTLARVVAKMQ